MSLVIFIIAFSCKGFSIAALIAMGLSSTRKSLSVIGILLLIGAVTAVWMAAGTTPALVYYSIQLIHPQYFVLSAFIITSFVSVLLGTSFGTVSTVGVALTIVAKGADINPHLIAGAIIAGAYFGDRCSPMSSSANLVASITKTKLYENIRAMIATTWLPLIASTLLYLLFSVSNPARIGKSNLILEIPQIFNINPLVMLPALAVLILALLQVEVKFTLLVSIATALVLGVLLQGYSFFQLIKFALLGFSLEPKSDLSEVLTGGGIVSMVKVSLVVVLSTALAGIIVGTKMLAPVERLLERASSRSDLFLGTTISSLASAMFGCTQTIAILMTQQLVQQKYEREKLDGYQLATDIENTAVVLSPLIPWNIAGLVPATILMTDSGFIPYAVYLYFLPLFNLIQLKLSEYGAGERLR
jgi:NhaC family Na+:H+ antiporter